MSMRMRLVTLNLHVEVGLSSVMATGNAAVEDR